MKSLQKTFLKGLFAVLPLAITLYLIIWIARTAETVFGSLLQTLLPTNLYIPGMGILIAIIGIFLFGATMDHYLPQSFIKWFNSKVVQVPFFKAIYKPLKDVMNLFATKGGEASKRVVLIEFQGVRLLGVVTRENFTEFQSLNFPEGLMAVYIPFSYAVGGLTVLVPKTAIKEVDLSVDKAMKLAITAWVKVDPQTIGTTVT